MEWRDVKGYEGLYEVSNLGVVRSKDRVTTGNRKRRIYGKVLRAAQNSNGYVVVALCKDGKAKVCRIHRIVADAFLPCDDTRPYINHKDGNPRNNNVRNLERCTQSENVQHAYDMGLKKPNRSLTNEQISYIKSVYVPYSRDFGSCALARKLGVDPSTIWRAIDEKAYLD